MMFESDEPTLLNEQFCSVEIFVPSQVVPEDDAFGLLASAWFGTMREDIATANGVQPVTIGLHSATLTIETCGNSRMRSDTRYRGEPLTLSYKGLQDEVAKNALEGSAEAGFSAPLLRVFKLKADSKAKAEKSATDSARRVQDATFEVHEVDTASPKGWSIEAINPARPQPHLKGAELRDAALCMIATPNGTASVTARLDYRRAISGSTSIR